MRLSITAKFNLVFLAIFAVGFAVAGVTSHELLERNAKEEVLGDARILMEAANAVRTYTQTQITPLLAAQMKTQFLPQSVPSYSAAENLDMMRKRFPEYAYKDATLNPTNPRDRAADWEVDVVQRLRDAPETAEFVGERDTPVGRTLYIARPIQIRNEACLACHSTIEAAPRTMVDAYGPNNGFGWRMNEVLPSREVLERIAAAYPIEPLEASAPGETAQRWRYLDGGGEVGVISSVTRAFCHECNRARLSTEGKLFLCLFASRGHDLRALLRGRRGDGRPWSDDEIAAALDLIWSGRDDRYSALRAAHAGMPASGERRVEMHYIGG